jgi:hypothetical protein
MSDNVGFDPDENEFSQRVELILPDDLKPLNFTKLDNLTS